jgi:predicted DsbA family dithiol-disulfide isomerase
MITVIAKRYGSKVQSVTPNFDARAMNEIGFRRDNEWSIDKDEFEESYQQLESHELTAAAEGDVQGEAEEKLLESLQAQLLAVEKTVADDGVLMIESEQGLDYPKTRHTQTNQLVGNENRLFFRFTVEPPLRVAVYRKR